jgi:selenocysteine lyase/cysteine desulfurase
VTFYTTKPPSDVKAAFQSANIEVTVRDGTVRVSPALFNNAEEIDRCLATTKKLV